eukprot:38697-Chlamydomonas_euryale.AAC.2
MQCPALRHTRRRRRAGTGGWKQGRADATPRPTGMLGGRASRPPRLSQNGAPWWECGRRAGRACCARVSAAPAAQQPTAAGRGAHGLLALPARANEPRGTPRSKPRRESEAPWLLSGWTAGIGPRWPNPPLQQGQYRARPHAMQPCHPGRRRTALRNAACSASSTKSAIAAAAPLLRRLL